MTCECAICKNKKSFVMPDEIIQAAIKNELVLFCGAGISTENRNVLPSLFYEDIQEELSCEAEQLSFCDLMEKYCSLPNGRRKLIKKIRQRFDYIHSFPEIERQATKFHVELSEIFLIKTIVTTNWDTYFEEYCRAIPITSSKDVVLMDDDSRYVLKLHGSINNIGSVVATREDYEKCYEKLQNGIIGAKLKDILVSKTVVFIGFSFGDDDFIQVLDYLRKELGDFYPDIFIVTLDETMEEWLNIKNATYFITDGTYFLRELKEKLQQEKVLCCGYPIAKINECLEMFMAMHKKISKIDSQKYPCVVFTLMYQDGFIHAIERFLQNYDTGEYNIPDRLSDIADKYNMTAVRCCSSGNYCDMSYFHGYENGLQFLKEFYDKPNEIDLSSFMYLPTVEQAIDTFEQFMINLEKTSSETNDLLVYAREVVRNINDSELVVHHPPWG